MLKQQSPHKVGFIASNSWPGLDSWGPQWPFSCTSPSLCSSPLIHSFTCCGFSYPQFTTGQEQMILLLTYPQKVGSSLTVNYNASVIHLTQLFISGHFMISHQHEKKGGYSSVRQFERVTIFTQLLLQYIVLTVLIIKYCC